MSNDGIPSNDRDLYLSLHLLEEWQLNRLYDELPDGDVGLEMINDELDRRSEKEDAVEASMPRP